MASGHSHQDLYVSDPYRFTTRAMLYNKIHQNPKIFPSREEEEQPAPLIHYG
jgi:hypothetical protein